MYHTHTQPLVAILTLTVISGKPAIALAMTTWTTIVHNVTRLICVCVFVFFLMNNVLISHINDADDDDHIEDYY